MTDRNHFLDHIKALACLSIVLHHLAFYSPMAEVLHGALPAFIDWLADDARMAVQIFLVISGYLTTAALAPQGTGHFAQWWPPISQRFVRLSLPYCAALVMALVINATVRNLGFDHESVSANPTWDSVLAHLLLLHSLGGWESISAGVWYVAIDFQLYALCALWLWVSSRQHLCSWLGQAGVVAATAASLFSWNLNSDLDIWALYFMGAYGLGMMAWWSTHAPTPPQRLLWVLILTGLGVTALSLFWRERIALALVMAMALAIGGNLRWPQAMRHWHCAPLTWIGQRSYSIFLIHFPMSLLVSAEVSASWPHSMPAAVLGMLLSIGLSLAAAEFLYEWTEQVRGTWRHLHRWQLGVMSTGVLATLTQNF